MPTPVAEDVDFIAQRLREIRKQKDDMLRGEPEKVEPPQDDQSDWSFTEA